MRDELCFSCLHHAYAGCCSGNYIDANNHCPQIRLLWLGRTSGLIAPVEGCLLRNNLPGGPDEPFGAHPVQGCHMKIILTADVSFQQINKLVISLVTLPGGIRCQ